MDGNGVRRDLSPLRLAACSRNESMQTGETQRHSTTATDSFLLGYESARCATKVFCGDDTRVDGVADDAEGTNAIVV